MLWWVASWWSGLGDLQGNEVVGCVGVRQDQGWLRCNAEVGYWIGRAHWGHGMATEARRLTSDWAFSELTELTRLYAPIFDWNTASRSVAKRAGYALEGRMPLSAIKAGRVISRVIYAKYSAT